MPIKPDNAKQVLDEAERQFVLWALRALRLPLSSAGDRRYQLQIPECCRQRFGVEEHVLFTFDSPEETGEEGLRWTFDSDLWSWLREELQERGGFLHTAPSHQPAHVHEFSDRLFEAYQVEGGGMHLGGCTLEDRPLLRLTFCSSSPAADGSHAPRLVHRVMTADGKPLDADQQFELGLDQLQEHRDPPRVRREQLEAWRDDVLVSAQPSGRGELIVTTVIWCKYAAGKVVFEIGEARGEVAFAAWAKPLLDGHTLPPPYHCPVTGQQSFRVAATDSGCISVQEAIGTCEVSAARVLVSELANCEATGKRVRSTLLEECPVSGARVLGDVLVTCGMCQQAVSPLVVRDGRCRACRSLRKVSKDDPRMARILGEHPQLDRWARWRIAETSSVYVVTASALVRRLLVVIDRESLQPLRLAIGSRFSRSWTDAPPADQSEFAG